MTHQVWSDFPEQNAFMYTLRNGIVYTATHASRLETERVPNVLLLSLTSRPLTVHTKEKSLTSRAIIIRSKTRRRIDIQNSPFTAVHIDPSHPVFRSLRTHIGTGKIEELDSEAFSPVMEELCKCYKGEANFKEAGQTFDNVVRLMEDQLVLDRKVDPRISAVLSRLVDQSPLDYDFKDLLDLACLSPGRFSHLFTEQTGVSLRTYQTWRKVMEALRLLTTEDTLTSIAHESGFSDSAHFSRTFAKSFGLIPSLFRNNRCVQVITRTPNALSLAA